MRSTGGLAFLALLLPAESFAVTRSVCASGCDFTTFVAASAAALDTDVIEFRDSGTYAGTDIVRNITVQVLGSNTPTINTRLHIIPRLVTVSGVRLAGSTNHCLDIDGGAAVTVRNLTIENCSGAGGGGIYASAGGTATWITVDNVTFRNNTTTVDGAHIGVTGNVNVIVSGSTFLADVTAGKGGAISAIRAGSNPATGLSVTNSTFTGTTAPGLGGAIYSDMPTLITGSWFTGSRTTSSGGDGGAIYALATLTARRNVFCKTDSWGAAVYLAGAGANAVTNNVFVGNTSQSGGGALVAFSDTAPSVVAFNHFVSNGGPVGGAVWIRGNTSSFHSNLFAYNTGGSTGAVYGNSAATTQYSLYFSNITANTGGLATTTGTDLVGKDPVLNGYDSKTALCGKGDIDELYPESIFPSKSPLIDAGEASTKDLDGTRADIGAFGGPQADPAVWADVDKDGYRAWVDCNDSDATSFPGPLYTDLDGDGYGTTSAGVSDCPRAGLASKSGDCDDTKSTISPGKAELCSTVGVDDNCNGSKDEVTATDAVAWYVDSDSDKYGGLATTKACAQPVGYVATGTDCDDSKSTINPGAAELCSTVGVDDNCNGAKDEATATDGATWYTDADADKYGTSTTTKACTLPSGYANNNKDCNDGNAAINPAAFELCATVGVDDNCDGSKDEASAKDAPIWYLDADVDTWGSATTAKQCGQPTGYVNRTGDCNDAAKTVSPSAPEVCGNGVDDNCDGIGGGTSDDDGDKLTYAQEQLAKSSDCLTDSDVDGVSDFVEFGPGPSPRDTDGDGFANAVDADDDGDGVPSVREVTAGADPLLVDSDNDLVPDGEEWGTALAAKDTDKDATPDVLDDDDDGDSVPTVEEGTNDFECANKSCKLACDGVPNYLDLDSDGDGKSDQSENSGDLDLDDDGVDNFLDCNDGDGGLGDNDGDGLTNVEEAKLGTSPTEVDTDDDGIDDLTEVETVNAPKDTDDDGVIDALDPDDDGDGFSSLDEIGDPLAPEDTDEDGIDDFLDDDDDGDGVPSGVELDGDQDVDGIPNYLDGDDEDGPAGDADADGLSNQDELDAGTDPLKTDSDADGVPDEMEVGDPANPDDSDEDGIVDAQDDDDDDDDVPTADEGGFDLDGDGLPNNLDTDSDGDGVEDGAESDGDPDCDGAPAFLDFDETDGPCMQDARETPDPDAINRAIPSCSTAPGGVLWPVAALILLAGSRRRLRNSP